MAPSIWSSPILEVIRMQWRSRVEVMECEYRTNTVPFHVVPPTSRRHYTTHPEAGINCATRSICASTVADHSPVVCPSQPNCVKNCWR